MFNLDDAIKHCEEVAERHEEDISKWEYTLSEYRKRECVEQTTIPRCEKALNKCKQCASEHRQLAEWLKDYKLLLEQEPSVSENPNNCEMRDATLEERESIDKYIKSISKPTGVKFGALEQEPSDDCISRQAVLDLCKKEIDHISKNWQNYHSPSEAKSGFVYITTNIYELPSVKPQERTGHWEWVQYDYNPKIGNWHCTECRCIVVECVDKNEKGGIPLYKYCPQCGAKMEVEQNG